MNPLRAFFWFYVAIGAFSGVVGVANLVTPVVGVRWFSALFLVSAALVARGAPPLWRIAQKWVPAEHRRT
jgi:hypothetical protein